MGNLFLPVLIVAMAGMMFMSSRKQKQAQQERQDSLNKIQPGDEIVTIGGLHGLFHEEDTAKGTITLDCEGVYLVFDKAAIKSVKASVSSSDAQTSAEESVDAPVVEEDTSADQAQESFASDENQLGFKQDEE